MFLLLAAIAVCGGVYWYSYIKSSDGVKPEIYEVKKGTLERTVEAVGTLEPETSVDLSFQKSGEVSEVLFAVGDGVKEGDILAKIANGDESAGLAQAKASVAEAQANLNLKLAGATDEAVAMSLADVQQAEANRSKTKVDLANASTDLENTRKTVLEDLKTAKLDLENAKLAYARAQITSATSTTQGGSSVTNAVLQVKSSIGQLLVSAKATMQSMDKVYGINGNSIFSGLTNFIDQLSFDYNDGRHLLFLIMADYEALQKDYSLLGEETGPDKIIELDSRFLNLINDINEDILLTSGIVDTAITGAQLPISELSALKSDITSTGTGFNNAVSGYRTNRKTLDDAMISSTGVTGTAPLDLQTAKNQMDQMSQKLVKTKVDGDIMVSDKESMVKSFQAQLNVQQALVDRANASLRDVLATPRNVDIAPYQARVSQAQSQVEQAKNNYEKTLLRSPIGGVVTLKGIESGEQVMSGGVSVEKVAFRVIDKNAYHVDVDVPETQIDKLSKDSKVEMDFDAFDDGSVFPGEIVSIEPAATVVDGIVYYGVKVMLKDMEGRMKPGMTVNVRILAAPKKDVLTVPEKAVLKLEGRKAVMVINGSGKPQEVEVRVGIRGNDGMVEIVSGLEAGQKIITNWSPT